MENVISMKNVTKQFKNFKLGPLNLDIKRGYITGFIGANGSGKTTAIKTIMNLISIDSGNIDIFGKNIKDEPIFIKNKIGFLYDEVGYYEMLKVSHMAKIVSRFYDEWNWEAFRYHIKKFKINENEKISNLSRGTKVKFSLAIALSHNAEILILDEPMNGLDPLGRDEIMDVFQEIVTDERKSIFLSSHMTEDLEKIADNIVFINDGKIILDGAKDDIIYEHYIIKGTEEKQFFNLEKNIIYKQNNKYGIEALCKIKDEDTLFLEDNLIQDKTNLKDIMIGYIKGSERNV